MHGLHEVDIRHLHLLHMYEKQRGTRGHNHPCGCPTWCTRKRMKSSQKNLFEAQRAQMQQPTCNATSQASLQLGSLHIWNTLYCKSEVPSHGLTGLQRLSSQPPRTQCWSRSPPRAASRVCAAAWSAAQRPKPGRSCAACRAVSPALHTCILDSKHGTDRQQKAVLDTTLGKSKAHRLSRCLKKTGRRSTYSAHACK